MGWNTGYRIMEQTVIEVYNAGILTPNLLEKLMEPYKHTDCDSGGSRDLKANDGLGVEEIICKVMEPEKYKDVIKNPKYYEGEPERWESNEKAYELFYSIWNGKWGIF
ncbi:hypothetical protein OCV51_01430 [Faecalicatena acetigenes]|uniref:Uncharacterized protein n=1 Tax=Faecalicatena acetigenes TaxID=2981790 RepID=A0ABT2T7X4_9FIRM|nr:hypothetical protein [Faecalicatena acetigenes]MCU6746330.1 hypothetical protein [Faecalicatena acetigenes]